MLSKSELNLILRMIVLPTDRKCCSTNIKITVLVLMIINFVADEFDFDY